MTPSELMVLRRQHNLTQAEFGARLVPPVSRLTVSNWERERFAIPRDIMARMVKIISEPAKPSKEAQAFARATLEVYRGMRKQPYPVGTHASIVAFWQSKGFTPSPEAQAMIAAEFPDILKGT
jgi:DNA-binding XRE family transcriptional regulator